MIENGRVNLNMSKTKAEVVGKWKFSTPSELKAKGQTYNGYLNYTMRDEAIDINNDFHLTDVQGHDRDSGGFVGYTSRDTATLLEDGINSGLTPTFDGSTLNMSPGEVQTLRHKLDQAFKDQTPLTYVPFSFDTNFLVKNGYYDPQTGVVDQAGIKEAFQAAMPVIKEQMGLNDSFFWWGDIHMNKDHLHGHLNFSETKSDRPLVLNPETDGWDRKGYVPAKAVKAFKRTIYNELSSDRNREQSLELKKDLAQVRKNLIDSFVVKEIDESQIQKLYRQLPDNKKHWLYGHKGADMKAAKQAADKIIAGFLNDEGQDLYTDFKKDTQRMAVEYRHAYGEHSSQDFEHDRELELRTRLANSLFKQCKNLNSKDLKFSFDDIQQQSDPKNIDATIMTIDEFKRELELNRGVGKRNTRIPKQQATFERIKDIDVDKYVQQLKQDIRENNRSLLTTKDSTERKNISEKILTDENLVSVVQDYENGPFLNARYVDYLKELSKTRKEDSTVQKELIANRILLKQQNLKLEDADLNRREKQLEKLPDLNDQAFQDMKEYKRREIREKQELVHLQQKNPFKLREEQKDRLLMLKAKYLNPVNVRVDDMSQDSVNQYKKRSLEERGLLSKFSSKNEKYLKDFGYQTGNLREEKTRLTAYDKIMETKLSIRRSNKGLDRSVGYDNLKKLYRDVNAVGSSRRRNYKGSPKKRVGRTVVRDVKQAQQEVKSRFLQPMNRIGHTLANSFTESEPTKEVVRKHKMDLDAEMAEEKKEEMQNKQSR